MLITNGSAGNRQGAGEILRRRHRGSEPGCSPRKGSANPKQVLRVVYYSGPGSARGFDHPKRIAFRMGATAPAAVSESMDSVADLQPRKLDARYSRYVADD